MKLKLSYWQFPARHGQAQGQIPAVPGTIETDFTEKIGDRSVSGKITGRHSRRIMKLTKKYDQKDSLPVNYRLIRLGKRYWLGIWTCTEYEYGSLLDFFPFIKSHRRGRGLSWARLES